MTDKDVARIYREMEIMLIDSMNRNLGLHTAEESLTNLNYPQWQAIKLRELRKYQQENKEIISGKLSSLPDEVANHLREELKQGYECEISKFRKAIGERRYKSAVANADSFFKINGNKVNALIKELNGSLREANHAVLRMANDTYRDVIAKVGLFVSNGVLTEQQAVDMALKDFLNRGLNCIEYKDGRRVNIADYTSMAVRTANQRAYMAGEGEFRKEIGNPLVIISKHNTACKLCQPFESKVFIDDVYSGGTQTDGDYMLLSEAMKEGLFHPRCRHGLGTYYPEIDGINREYGAKYTSDTVADYGKYNEAHIANMVQKYTRLVHGCSDPENIKIYTAKLREWENKKKEFSSDNLDPPTSIGGVDCVVTNQMFSFSDGYGGVTSEIKAVVYETPDGTKFVFPEKLNTVHQQMTPEKAISLWNKVPQEIRSRAQKTIEFLDTYNPADSYWRKRYKNFRHSYATGGDKITFWRYDYTHDDDYVIYTYCHEAGHFIDTSISKTNSRFSDEKLWTKAMKSDKIFSKKESCTPYGENANMEDFAESLAEYIKDKNKFSSTFPNRADLLDKILRKVI